MYKDQPWWLRLALIIWDCLVSVSAFLIAGVIKFGDFRRFLSITNAPELILIIVLSSVTAFLLSRMYRSFILRGYLREFISVVTFSFWMYIILLLYTFSTKNNMALSRLTLFYSIPVCIVLLYCSHIIIKKIIRSHASRKPGWKLLIITDLENVEQTCKDVQQRNGWKNKPSGLFVIDQKVTESDNLYQIPLLAPETDCVDYLNNNAVDEVLLSVGSEYYHSDQISLWLNSFLMAGAVVSVRVRVPEMDCYNVSRITSLGSGFVASFSNREYEFSALIIKRIMDVAGSVFGLLVTLIIGIFLAPAILIDCPGPILFKQKRVGRNGRIFTMYKFRSMYNDAEKRKRELMSQNKMKGLLFKVDNDPRVTRVGRFIRRTSIDELPQFFNVLKGDMSLVGTRPPTLDEYEHYTCSFKKRLSFRPGITGMWQTSGRNDVLEFDSVLKMDLQYIQDWSISLDIKLILKTLKILLFRKGAV